MTQKLNSNDLINKSQSELNELKIIIDDNLNRLIDRGNNLNDVKQSLDDLEIKAISFNTNCKQIKRKGYCKNKKYLFIITLALTLIMLFFFSVMAFLIYFFVYRENKIF